MRASALAALLFAAPRAWADSITLQNATADFSQGGFPVTTLNDQGYPLNDAGGVGWASDTPGTTSPQNAVFETVSNLNLPTGGSLRFNLFHGGFGTHTIGRYRVSYTTDDRSTFADGVADVTATWTPIAISTALSSGGATLTPQGDNSVLASGANPELVTDSLYATLGPVSGITGFRLETLADASFPTSGPGRSANGNIVAREFDVAAFPGLQRVTLQNGTAQLSQGGFSVDNIGDNTFGYLNAGGTEGWANNVLGNNIAVFETTANTPGFVTGNLTELSIDLASGGFSTHTLGKFRISATTVDRALFADGNDNGGAGVGTENIWTILDPLSITSDQPGVTFTEDANNIILVGGANPEYATYNLKFLLNFAGITGFRLEAFEDPSFPGNGPGRAANGNFVVREFQVFAAAQTPEPGAIATGLVVIGVGLAGYGMRRRNRR